MIAYILDTFPSRSETFIAREIDALRRHGLEVRVWALNAGQGAAPIERSNLERISGKLRGANEWQKLGAVWYQRERESLRDVRHFHGAWASHPADIARGAARTAGLPWSFSGHARDLWVDSRNLGAKLTAASFATTCTRAGQAHLRAQAPAQAAKVLYAPHGLQMARFSFAAPILERHSPLQILAVGRLVPKKGIAILLESLTSLRFDFHCVIIGDGPLRPQLEARCRRDGLSERVSFAGALDENDVQTRMRQSDVLVHSGVVASDGDRDGLPNVLLEAAALGLPIVSSTAGSVGDCFDDTGARLCEPGDVAALSAALDDVRHDFETTLALCREARRRVEARFDIDANCEILRRAFADAAG